MQTLSERTAHRWAPGAAAAVDWRDRAVCANADPELWFPLPSQPASEAAAIALCAGCPVTAECRAWADGQGITYGVWAGEPEAHRQARLAAEHAGVAELPAAGGDRPTGTCEQCGRPFLLRSRGEQRRFCSHRCHHLSMAKESGSECGTTGGARRHRKRGEPVDDACRMAETLYRAQRKASRREQVAA